MAEDPAPPSEFSAEPSASGTLGNQEVAQDPTITVLETADWKEQESFSGSLRSVHDGRRFVAGALMNVVSAGVRMLEDQLTSVSSDRRAADERERKTLERYYGEKERAAVSQAQLGFAADSSRLRSIMQNIGSLLVGAAVSLYITPCPQRDVNVANGGLNPSYIAAAFAVIGIALIVCTIRGRRSLELKGGS